MTTTDAQRKDGSEPGKPCGCPPSAKATIGGVLVTGHTAQCPGSEPRRYVWQDAGILATGTLATYGEAYTITHDESLPSTGLGQELRTWEASYQVEAEGLAGEPGDDGCWPVRLSVPGEQVTVRVWAL